MILVTGATGNVGGELTRILAERGEPVRALIREGSATDRLPEGAETAIGDLNRPESVAAALDDVRAAHLLSGYDGLETTLALMHGAGVERVTLQSSSAVPGGDLDNAVSRYHIVSERLVRESGVGWTFLQSFMFMTNALDWADQIASADLVRARFAGVRTAAIDPRDIAAVAAQALIADGHEGRTYTLSGPESLLPAERVAILGRVLGRELRFEAQPDDEARVEMEAQMPAEYVDAFFSYYADGKLDESPVLPTVEQVTGTPPRTFEQWARAHAEAFATG